jgi:hypothetical protein
MYMVVYKKQSHALYGCPAVSGDGDGGGDGGLLVQVLLDLLGLIK